MSYLNETKTDLSEFGAATTSWLPDPETHNDREKWQIIDLAQSLAEYLLRNQKDKQGRPLTEHVRRVYNACRSLSLEQRLAAILHDVIEDGSTPELEGKQNRPYEIRGIIEVLFGKNVHNLVYTLSRKDHQTYDGYIHSITQKPDAILIKLADLNDNLDERRGPIPDSLRQRYLKARDYLQQAAIEAGIHNP